MHDFGKHARKWLYEIKPEATKTRRDGIPQAKWHELRWVNCTTAMQDADLRLLLEAKISKEDPSKDS